MCGGHQQDSIEAGEEKRKSKSKGAATVVVNFFLKAMTHRYLRDRCATKCQDIRRTDPHKARGYIQSGGSKRYDPSTPLCFIIPSRPTSPSREWTDDHMMAPECVVPGRLHSILPLANSDQENKESFHAKHVADPSEIRCGVNRCGIVVLIKS